MKTGNYQSTYLGLLRYVKPYRLVFFVAILGAIVDAAMKAFFIWSLSYILEKAFELQDPLWI